MRAKLSATGMPLSTNWLASWGQDIALDVEHMIYIPKDENGHEIPVADFVKIQALELEAWQRWLWQHVFQDDYAKILDIEQMYWERWKMKILRHRL